ncbi:hypothetical protein [Pseudoalteromonas luteoviolacea]|uniref:Uncharacterized protein n=1 Tax=Pseudoalteromonas luteoviolacea S4054 TaxID=1129367 RepID=A0A0F6AFC4_9GAMM|nr:hypothetical protein [Pseudoalteromonas luteoviolacea]KKE84905.1 hypothetical protein N479_07355 [Pseudoalteromonas luteoviolacea S4054]KZN72522.1 hypothetical protein N481_14945 [Pseudoalteromonas luteoviolacea S4047-1]
MLNSAATCGNTQTAHETVNTITTKPQIQWMAWLSKIGRALSLSHAVMYK